jgi:hypothetical protein
MSGSAQGGNENIRANYLSDANETLMQTNHNAEATDQGKPLFHQDEISMTLKEFDAKLKHNDRSIKRIEESMVALYDKLDRTLQAEEPKIQSNRKVRKDSAIDKKNKKEKKLDKKNKKEKKLDKKNKKEKKLDKKNKNRDKAKGPKKTKSRKSIPVTERKKQTNTKDGKGMTKNAGKKR